jgi:hypothetical protein
MMPGIEKDNLPCMTNRSCFDASEVEGNPRELVMSVLGANSPSIARHGTVIFDPTRTSAMLRRHPFTPVSSGRRRDMFSTSERVKELWWVLGGGRLNTADHVTTCE